MERIALFAGSFDPFTIGHKDIVDRALPLFDKIVIGVGINPTKKPWMPTEDRLAAIRKAFEGTAKVDVASFEGLAIDFANSVGARFLLRGVRTVADFEYERNMADANRLITAAAPIETVFLTARPELGVISSSLVRELARFGAPYRQFLP